MHDETRTPRTRHQVLAHIKTRTDAVALDLSAASFARLSDEIFLRRTQTLDEACEAVRSATNLIETLPDNELVRLWLYLD